MEVLGLFYFPTWLFYVIAVVTLYLVYMTWDFNVFRKKNIPGPTPYPVIGTLLNLMKNGSIKNQRSLYSKYKERGIYGSFEGRVPVYHFCKPEHAKEITVKKFNDFVNRRIMEGIDDPKPLEAMLTNIKDDHWKFVRNTLTPTFSGRKLRREVTAEISTRKLLVQMVSLINEAADSLIASLDKKVKNKEDIDIRGHFGAFTMDVISSTAFGIKVDAQNDPGSPFVASAKKFFDFSFTSPIFLIFFFFPFLASLIKAFRGIKTQELSAVFIDVTKDNIKFRKENNTKKYVDSLQLMLDTQKEKDTIDNEDEVTDESDVMVNGELQTTSSTWTRKKGLTDDEILAQSVLFFIAGYETTANTLSFTLYYLALNPECCEKATEEIDTVLGKNNPTYDNINQLTYLEMCVSETLRLLPLAHRLERIASRDTEIGGVTIPKDSFVTIPVASIQMDEKYWPEPQKFDPERFTPENKAKRDPYVYMPFGMGPRNCIGMRLALLEGKIALAKILQNYTPVKCPKTKVPLDLPKLGNLAPKGGVWIRLEPRH